MKFKHLLLTGLLAVAGLAQAQGSNVQIFGIIDQSVVTQKGLGLNNTNINSSTTSSSNIGFRGVEKLGDGYGVGFNLEAGVSLATGNTGNTLSGVGGTSASNSYTASSGTASVFNRQANMQIDAPVGQFLVGRQYTPFLRAQSRSDAMMITSGGVSTIMSSLGGTNNRNLTGSTTTPLNTNLFAATTLGNPGMWSNGISYKTKEWNGLTAHVMYGVNQSTSTATGENSWDTQGIKDISLTYEKGPYFALVGYQEVNDNTGNKYNASKLAAAGYTWNNLTFKGTYANRSFGNCSQNTAGGNCMNKTMSTSAAGVTTAATYAPIGTAYGDEYDLYAFGVSWKATERVRVAGQVTQVNDQVNTANKFTMNSIYADYSFSKRTRVYALASLVQNQGGSNMSPIFGMSAQTSSNGQDITAYAVGLRHTF